MIAKKAKLSFSQKEVMDHLAKHTAEWVHPDNLPHWIKNAANACKVLDKRGYIESKDFGRDTCYRLKPTSDAGAGKGGVNHE